MTSYIPLDRTQLKSYTEGSTRGFRLSDMADEDGGEQRAAPTALERSLRVVVRIRPAVSADGDASCTLLRSLPGQASLSLRHPQDTRASKQYNFDAVLDVGSTQDELYRVARMDDLVGSVVSGYHATVFAYGQTGSGKTFSMEGYRYVTPPVRQQAGRHQPRPVPHADFDATAPEQLGLVPRAVAALFEAAQRSVGRRTSVKVSFVQLYKEQVYDLLNPSGAGVSASQQQPQSAGWGAGGGSAAGRGAPLPGRPLHMRWSKAQEFYLENLFKVECSSCAEVMAAFRQGVRAKVMASHAMNAASSRSHALLTLYVDSHPLTSPGEVTSSRLTLVDLAGSERSAATGAVQGGVLHDESVAINKSLLTLRQVIVALTSQARQQQQHPLGTPGSTPSPGGGGGGVHVPYRDSKLTALLKQSLGGNSLTTMLACVACVDGAYEENVSTLDYAAMARRVVNQVAVNEDPRTRIIRELRLEVHFLRAQLAALQAPQALGQQPPLLTAALAPPQQAQLKLAKQQGLGSGGDDAPAIVAAASQASPAAAEASGGTQALQDSAQAITGSSDASAPVSSADSDAVTTGQHGEGLVQPSQWATSSASTAGDSGSGGGGGSALGMKAALLQAAEQDMRVIVDRLLASAALVQHLSATNQELRSAYDTTASRSDALRVDNDGLMTENTALRDRLCMLEGMAGMGPVAAGGGGGAGVQGGAMLTAGTAALIELQELRQENALLHVRLQAAEFLPQQDGAGAQVLVLDGKDGDRAGRAGGGGAPRKVKGLQRASSQASAPPGSPGYMRQASSNNAAAALRTQSMSSYSAGSAPGSAVGVLSSSPAILSVSDLRAMLSSGGRGVEASKADSLSTRTHQLASHNLLSGSRVTTTGQMLPGAALATGPSAQVVSHTEEAMDGADTLPTTQSAQDLSPVPAGDEMAARLAQLMSARNALARGRVTGAS